MTTTLNTLQNTISYQFKDVALLKAALTHPSASGKKPAIARAYERLEFLGDRVLGLVIADWLLELYPDQDEGAIARHHALMVKRDTLVKIATHIHLLDALTLAKNESTGGRGALNIQADALEALLGAIYHDGGLKPAQKFIRTQWAAFIDQPAGSTRDAKTALQEWAQGHGLPVPVYEVLERTGPAHAPAFVVQVTVGKEKPARANGPSKRAAEMMAAELLYKALVK